MMSPLDLGEASRRVSAGSQVRVRKTYQGALVSFSKTKCKPKRPHTVSVGRQIRCMRNELGKSVSCASEASEFGLIACIARPCDIPLPLPRARRGMRSRRGGESSASRIHQSRCPRLPRNARLHLAWSDWSKPFVSCSGRWRVSKIACKHRGHVSHRLPRHANSRQGHLRGLAARYTNQQAKQIINRPPQNHCVDRNQPVMLPLSPSFGRPERPSSCSQVRLSHTNS